MFLNVSLSYIFSEINYTFIHFLCPLYYLLFESVHLLSHNYRGTNNIIINAKQYHKLHHITETTNYGFLTPFWDYICGTLSPSYKINFIEIIFGFIPLYSFFMH
jgi:sterol desaturase/sphingolipid hydroxylase (fatty acid hydroxylase superfamily)